MTKHRPTVHDRLDGDAAAEAARPTAADREELARYRDTLDRLETWSVRAPDVFTRRVMSALPERRGRGWTRVVHLLWPERGPWLGPALAGAVAMLLLFVAVGRVLKPGRADHVAVTFELHAPGAEQVELVGSFNSWEPGALRLAGPDATGHWTATVALPKGRHEYVFVVDGREWIADPTAVLHRPDGFGRVNAVLDL